ncbi:hypothetical protein [Sinomonas terrae]|uniref:Uncharacterized protein n=1 Tax=Sinomonas terrae TaxID=2908838 RepID=A0ABS9TZM2_9MICC|nr:hypothetical protein [Sinomonas terrae]MCH6469873.1 hypothetical protein [Sinomonas terrae]
MTPADRHRFGSHTEGITLDLRWRPPAAPLKERLRSLARRAIIGGPDPYSPNEMVPQTGFDAAVDLLRDGDADGPALAFDRLGYDCRLGMV